jgi:catechol 2,3-dioxygenase
MTTSDSPNPIDPEVRIGHVHLKVADLERALTFYCGVLGFDLTQRYGTQAAFVSAGGYHHHIGLNTWNSAGASPPAPDSIGLRSFDVALPDSAELDRTLERARAAGVDASRANGTAILRDPSGNTVRLSAPSP